MPFYIIKKPHKYKIFIGVKMTQSLKFPEVDSKYWTRIALRKYSRPRPNTPARTTLESTIRLPIPTSLQDSINAEIANPALDLLGNDPSQVLKAGATVTKEIADEIKGGKFSVEKAMQLATRAAALAPGISDTGIGRLAQSIEGVVRNPHLTTIFEGMRLKTYSFSWRLSPQSASEARALNNIIVALKRAMHPSIAAGGFALDYPYLAEVQFVDLNSAVIPEVRSSFITNLTVNGSPNGIPAFYRDGQPVAVDLSLQFQEINIQTREDISSPLQVGQGGIGITSNAVDPSAPIAGGGVGAPDLNVGIESR